ncbi:MAG: hypothetical protein AB7F99_06100 [Vicinamibacterales bacterium]
MATALMVAASAAAAEEVKLTGAIGDAMCGVKHMMDGGAIACTEACIKAGSDYALIVGEKAYTLKVTRDADKTALAKLAGQEATVSGELDGDAITVASVVAAAAR